MRLIMNVVVLLMLWVPARAETAITGFPFSLEAGPYRDLVLYPGEERSLRFVFPAVTVEHPSKERTILRLGQDRRVIVETRQGATGDYRTGAELMFGQAPLDIQRDATRFEIGGSLDAITLPLMNGADPAIGTIAFTEMAASLSGPMRAMARDQQAELSFRAASIQADATLLGFPATVNPPPLKTGAVDLTARLTLRLGGGGVDPATLPDAVRRVEIERADATLLGGKAMLSGTAVFASGASNPPDDLEGTLAIRDFTAMIQRLMQSRLIAPEQMMPFVLLAGALGRMAPDGTLTLDIETAPNGELVINGRPSALILAE